VTLAGVSTVPQRSSKQQALKRFEIRKDYLGFPAFRLSGFPHVPYRKPAKIVEQEFRCFGCLSPLFAQVRGIDRDWRSWSSCRKAGSLSDSGPLAAT
jgi:hypothetical protein